MTNQEAKPVIRATKETQHQLKVIAALTSETMQAVVARLVHTEYEQQLVKQQQKEGMSHEPKEG